MLIIIKQANILGRQSGLARQVELNQNRFHIPNQLSDLSLNASTQSDDKNSLFEERRTQNSQQTNPKVPSNRPSNNPSNYYNPARHSGIQTGNTKYQATNLRGNGMSSQHHIQSNDKSRTNTMAQFQSYNPHVVGGQNMHLLNKAHPNALEMKEAESIIHPEEAHGGRDSELGRMRPPPGNGNSVKTRGNLKLPSQTRLEPSRYSEKRGLNSQTKLRETMSKRLASGNGGDLKGRRKLDKNSLKQKLLGNQFRGKQTPLRSKIIRRSVNNRSIGGRKEMPKTMTGIGVSKSYMDNTNPLSNREEYRSHNEIGSDRIQYSSRGGKVMSNKVLSQNKQDVKLYKNNQNLGTQNSETCISRKRG